ncbi:MAG: hypothetical protein JST87_01540 [Bacteroidetes bacterium]|nr:hypothetical protein [Bacteroidota bacterium]MBS1934994.1 hypothetical protein [Bacteroidota bacterium]
MIIFNDIKKLPVFLVNTFYNRNIVYEIPMAKDDVIEKLGELFSERCGLFSSPNLYGKFTDVYSFVLKPKRSLISIRSFEQDPAYLNGTLSDTENGGTKIEVKLRPNSVFGILFITLALFAFYHLYQYFFMISGTTNNLFIFLFLVFIMVPILCAMAGTASHSLKENFEKYLGIGDAIPGEGG